MFTLFAEGVFLTRQAVFVELRNAINSLYIIGTDDTCLVSPEASQSLTTSFRSGNEVTQTPITLERTSAKSSLRRVNFFKILTTYIDQIENT